MKSLLFYNCILISILIQSFLTEDIPKITLDLPYQKAFEKIEQETNIQIDVSIPDNSSISYYLHFSTEPLQNQNQSLQQIIYSPNNTKPSMNNSEIYSFRYSRNANLITLAPNQTSKINIGIKCFKYPCSFNFTSKLEKNAANLYLDENKNYYLYNTNSIGKEKFNKMIFNIPPSSKEKLMITIINPGDIDGTFSTIYSIKNNERTPLKKGNHTNMGMIYVLDKDESVLRNELEIESLENQFITISLKSSSFKTEGEINHIGSEITLNTVTKFSNLITNGKKINECFKISENYIKNFLNNDKNNFVYASINFLTLPFKAYLKYSKSEKEIENKNEENSLNIILNKETNEYPQICFQQDNTSLSDNIFALELSHMYSNMENIDIYSPILSGFFTKKILLSNSLGIYTHYSDIHFIKKISFYLKKLKGDPIMYFVQCNNYPNCYNKIDELEKNPNNAFKAKSFGNYQFYSKKYEKLTKDLSPNGPSQNLLYVYCPSNSEGYCEFQILMYSNSEEIILNKNEDFHVVAEKEENLMFKLIMKKGDSFPETINFCFNATTDDINFDTMKDLNNATIKLIKHSNNQNCYRYEPDKKYNDINKKDLEIVFNIKAIKDINFVLKNNINENIKTEKIGEIIEINDFSFPYQLNYLIKNTTSDLLFNIYLNDKNHQGLNLSKVEIGVIILNSTYLLEIIDKPQINILNGSIKETLDYSTRSCSLKISKEYIKNIIKDNNKLEYYLHIVIVNNENNVNDNKNIIGKMFLLEKGQNGECIVGKNNFISDSIILENNTNKFNLYHLKLEQKEKLEIKFSSNYNLNDQFLVYLLEYTNANIDIDFIEKNKKSYKSTSIGQMYTFLYDNKDKNKSDVLLAVVSKFDKNKINLPVINYIFKYNTFLNEAEYNKKVKYEFNENYTLTKDNNKFIFEFDSIKKDGKVLKNNEIYIRQIKEKKYLNESFSTYAKIQNNYNLIKFSKKEEGDKTKITIDNLENNNYSYSIIIDNLEENEKFVVSNEKKNEPSPSPSPSDKNNKKDNGDNSLILKIVIPIAVVVVIVIAILIVLIIKRKKGKKINKDIMKTSFEGDGLLD